MKAHENPRLTAPVALMIVIIACVQLTLATGCQHSVVVKQGGHEDADIIATSYKAVDALLAVGSSRAESDRILVATLVDLNDFASTSTFGRVLSEQIAARLAQRGRSVAHVTIRNGSVVVNPNGQFLLSRELRSLSLEHNAAAALVGAYAITPETVFVTLKLARVSNNELVSGIDFELPLGPKTRAMLGLPLIRPGYGLPTEYASSRTSRGR